MAKSSKQLVEEASKNIETISVEQARLAIDDPGSTFVDLRDIRELQASGTIPGAYHMPRGMIEFWADPESPYFKKIFATDTRFVFYCSKGWRSALATEAAMKVGVKNICHIDGGFSGWIDSGGAVTAKSAGKSDGKSLAEKEGIYDLLPFVVNPDNIARFEDGKVLIGDRRKYPFSKEFFTCNNVSDVAQAIKDMVTQGSGPWMAAVNALRMVSSEGTSALKQARDELVATRPTNTAMSLRLDEVLEAATLAEEQGLSIDEAIKNKISAIKNTIYDNYALRARAMADLIEDGDGVLTMCFAEAGFLLALALAKRDGKNITAYVPETRPYLQGAKLTAPSINELGIEANLITDNMPAHIMAEGNISKYITAADLITVDGHVCNKIGTYQNAITAHAHDIPYFAFAWGRDDGKVTRADVEIEERDPAEIRQALGQATTIDEIGARYPTFDITPPKYVAGVITTSGVVSPYVLKTMKEW